MADPAAVAALIADPNVRSPADDWVRGSVLHSSTPNHRLRHVRPSFRRTTQSRVPLSTRKLL